jgi:3-dehydroquinate dehydratase / shikimate dehydrogenase
MPEITQHRSLFGSSSKGRLSGVPGRAPICRGLAAVVAAATAREMARQLRAALRETCIAELRLDWLRSDAERLRFLAWLGGWHLRGAVLIATCRRREAGGLYRGDVSSQLVLLQRAIASGCSWCDLEIESTRILPFAAAREFLSPARIMISLHDFRRTPPGLSRFVEKWRGRTWHRAADAVKIAAKARSIADSVRVLGLIGRKPNVVAMPMSDVGLPARVLALRDGSALAYAPVSQATAPGQLSLAEMKYLYRAHRLDRRTAVYGVIGDPIEHSLSPLMHNTGFVARGLNAVYLPFLVRDLRDFLGAVVPLGLRGFSVTLPHKHAILRHLDDCDPLAAQIGAVNTVVVRSSGRLSGANTDYIGVLRALERRLELRGSRVLLYGAGGAARAAAFALARAGAVVAVCARRPERARALARAVGGEALPRRALRSEFFDAIVNTTPVGMHPRSGVLPLEARELNCRVVMDLIYRPLETRLLALARRRGLVAVSGLEMFLAQGAAQWEIWTGRRAPEAAMRRAVLRVLRAEESASRPRGSR